ncbi:hypothetical protein DFH27DRAFT_567501, partial [Peziza echinospora]
MFFVLNVARRFRILSLLHICFFFLFSFWYLFFCVSHIYSSIVFIFFCFVVAFAILL